MARKAGRQRVRLSKGPSKQALAAMHEGRKRSHEKAPRRENGKVIQGYKYKAILEGYKEMGREPRALAPNSISRLPMFVDQPSLAKRIVKLIRKGYPYTTVCRYVGVTPRTFKEWLEKGKAGLSPDYVDFYERVARAEAEAEMRTIQTLKMHEKADWRVSAWQLERRWPEHWSKKDRVMAEMQVSATINVDSKEALGRTLIQDTAARELARRLIDKDLTEYPQLPSYIDDEEDA